MLESRDTIFLSADMPDVQQRIEAAPEGAEIIFGMGLYENLVLRPKPNQVYRSERINGAHAHILKDCQIEYPPKFANAVIRDLSFLRIVRSEQDAVITIGLTCSVLDCRFVLEDSEKIAAQAWKDFQEYLDYYQQRLDGHESGR